MTKNGAGEQTPTWYDLHVRTKKLIGVVGTRDVKAYTKNFDTASGFLADRIIKVKSEPIPLSDGTTVSFGYNGSKGIFISERLAEWRAHRSPFLLRALHEVREPGSSFFHTHTQDVSRFQQESRFVVYAELLGLAEAAIRANGIPDPTTD